MKTTDTLKTPKEKISREEAWKRFKSSQAWAANAPLPLMTRLFRANHLVANRFGEQIELSTPQMRVLFEALEPEGVSQATICKHYNIDASAVTRTVQAMERDGLVVRKVDPNDNRLMRVFITDIGRKLLEGLPEQVAEFERKLLDGWTDEEILQLHHLLEKLENSIN